MVEYVSIQGGWEMVSPIWGISVRKALWWLYSVRSVMEVVGGNLGASVGLRISQ